jgi:hypothetical protein
VVVQVLESNAVLKCEVTKNSIKKLETGQFATIRVLAYDPPTIRVSIAECAGTVYCCGGGIIKVPLASSTIQTVQGSWKGQTCVCVFC